MGSVIKKMNRLMKEYKLPEPQYEELSGNFLVTFKKRKVLDTRDLSVGIVPSLSQVCPKSVPSDLAVKILEKATIAVSITELMEAASQTNRTRFRNQMLNSLLEAGLIEMTIPDKPHSSKQKYIISNKGRDLLKK